MGLKEAEQVYCPHPENTTCSLQNPSLAASIILYTIFMTGIILATFGNLVVIISIAHFKQLHTPTNVLTLSMAVADFLIGIFIMPIKLIQTMDKCWDLGVHTCMAGIFCYTAISTISVTHLIFLSVDRYYAVCYPLHYSTKITLGRAWVFAAICWICSICYSALSFYVQFTFLFNEKNICVGFCYFVLTIIFYIVDMLFNGVLPFSVMLVLYSKICIVAIQHVKAVRNTRDEAHCVQKNKKGFTERQNKATVTVGVVIGTFVLFLSQFYIFILLSVFIKVSPLALNIAEYLVLFNFALNPLIYGLFYPWFRKGFKLIITCKIFKPDSSLINLFSENK
ncbi:trace amine-associated receptor 13c-like [Erpetoichthys calabaricus]|uniref:trace amine-associated receptor 13c-like n=1 Tax=Erpetoichthys calabaricus TaxID=27687 RepID=UPI002234E881|nr:trace amine-associated receptor 13c-like [Erpetoichthys calabaricus]